MSQHFNRLRSFLSLFFIRLLVAGVSFLKNVFVTRSFGLGPFSDAFFIFNSALGLFGGFFSQMGSGILLPLYNDQLNGEGSAEEIKMKQQHVIKTFIAFFTVLSIIMTVLVHFNPSFLINLMAPRALEKTQSYLMMFFSITLPLCLCFQLYSSFSSLLIQRRNFAKVHIPEIITGLMYILLFVCLYPKYHVGVVIWLLPFTQISMFVLYWKFLKLPLTISANVKFLKRILSLFPYNTLIWLSGALVPLVDNFYLSFLQAGNLSAFRFSYAMVSILTTLTVSSFQMYGLPDLLMAASQKNYVKLKQVIQKRSLEGLVVAIPIALLGYVLCPFVFPILFHHGAYNTQAVNSMIFCFKIMVYLIPTAAINIFLSNCYNSLYLNKQLLCLGYKTLSLRVILGWYGLKLWGLSGILWMIVAEAYLSVFVALLYLFYKLYVLQSKKKQA